MEFWFWQLSFSDHSVVGVPLEETFTDYGPKHPKFLELFLKEDRAIAKLLGRKLSI